MNEGEFPRPAPAGDSIEKVEKSALKSGESDAGSPSQKGINTYDDLRKDSAKGINTYDDFRDQKSRSIGTYDDLKAEPKKGINTYDDLRSEEPNGIETYDDLRKESQENRKTGEKIENETKKEDIAQNKWDKVKSEIENTADAEGYKIDEGIKDPIVALNALEINTSQSCEGHIDGGKSAPWIRITAPNKPEEMFIGQNETFEKVAKKYNIPLEEAKTQSNTAANKEAIEEYKLNGVTKDFQKWEEESGKLLYITKEILNDFYKDRQVPDNIKIKIDTESLEDMTEGIFEIFNGGEDYRDINGIELSKEEKESLAERLPEYRNEMQALSDFLKEKFFSEGEGYINGKRKIAQEKIDQEKIKKIEKILKVK